MSERQGFAGPGGGRGDSEYISGAENCKIVGRSPSQPIDTDMDSCDRNDRGSMLIAKQVSPMGAGPTTNLNCR